MQGRTQQSAPPAAPRVAVVLFGCGRADGSEVQESVALLVHLSRHHAAYRCFGPDQDQADVIDHLTGHPLNQRRNGLVEAARISRGDMRPITALHAADFDAIVFAGGFGAAKNLCTFAKDGARCTVHPQIERVIREFHSAGKVIGACCIAPVLVAKVLGTQAGGPGVTVTLGPDGPAAAAVISWGSHHQPRPATEACVDTSSRVVTAPAYMHDHATAWEVFTGIGQMIDGVIELARRHVAV